MKRIQLLLLGCLLSGLGSTFVHAEEGASATDPQPGSMFKRDPLEPAPSSLILDEARLLNEREASQLSARLEEFASRNDVLIYVVAYSVLFGESINDRAARLKDSWLEGKRGIVVVYQRGTERLTFSSTADPLNYVTRTELETLFAGAYAQASQFERGGSRLIAAVDQLMADLPVAIQMQRTSNTATASETRDFVAWALSGLVLLTVAGMVVFHLLRRGQTEVTTTYTFPTIRVPERFGAAYCGGHQAEMQFKAPSA